MSRIILNFHGIGTPHDGVPEDERPYWLTEEAFQRIVTRVAELSRAGHDIAMTFDDGNRSDLDIAAPRLEEAGLTGAFYILTGRIGATHYLSADDIRALATRGHDIGLHGVNHVDWRTIAPSDFEAETVTARRDLAEVLGAPITTVSIPFGAYNRSVLTRLRGEGYAAIYTSDRGPAETSGPVISRNTIRSDMTEADIDAVLMGRESFKTRLRRMAGIARRRYLN